MHTTTANVSEGEVSGTAKEVSQPGAGCKPGSPPICCGKPMEPRLARARDRSGEMLFVAVQQCSVCGGITSSTG